MYKKTKAWLMMSLLAAFVAGCGGGGGSGSGSGSTDPPSTSQTLSGTAAEGAAISGSVYLKDKNGNTKTGTADGNGKYTIDVTDLSLPLLLKISSSNGVDYYSVATATGTANIHPFTDLIIRNWYKVKGSNVETDFSGSGALAKVPTAEEINTIEAVVRNVLATTLSALGVDPDSFNLITSSFDADSTKFDELLDNSSVAIDDTGNVTVTVEDPDTGVSGTIISTEITTDIAATDATAPSDPSTLLATAGDTTKIVLLWNSSTDNIGIAGYNIYRGGVNVGTSPYPGYIDSGLTASTEYCYQVEAFDAAGNLSNKSAQACATTLTTADTSKPSAPAGLTATVVSSSQIDLAWTASTDNVEVFGYKIYSGTTQIGTSSTTSFSHTGLTANTAYSYTVKAFDLTGNLSSASNTATATTASGTTTTTNPLIGSWLGGTVGSGQETVVTFLDSTHYTMAHNGIADEDGQPGIESGTYTWNAGTGAFTASPTTDTNGDWGFSHPQGSVTVSVSGDTLTFNDTVEGSYVFARVLPSETNPIIGSWLGGTVGSGQETVVTFLDSTHYTMAHNGIADSGGQPGIESGTYTWDAGTGAFTASPTTDTNGDWGFSHPQGSVTVSISGDTLTFNDTVEGSYVFARVQ